MTQPPTQHLGNPDDKEFMMTLAKGLAVLGAFGRQRPTMTLSEAAQVVDLSRATARRVLRTLTILGFVEQNGRTFSLSPQILDLGFAYLSTQSWIDRALPLMRELSERSPNPARPRSCKGTTSSMSRASRRGGSCRPRCQLAAGCRPCTPRSAASCSAISTKPRSGVD